jgi:single-strand DNA-binding protein
MANLNKVMLIGRLTRDPEVRTFSNGGKVAKFGFAVNNRKKNQTTGEWEEDPVFIDVDAFSRENGRKLADLVEQYLRKGHQAYIEGNLVLDQWTDKDGQKRSKLKLNLQDLQFLEPKSQDGMGGGGMSQAPRAAASARQSKPTFAGNGGGSPYDEEQGPTDEPPARGGSGGQDEDIPF